MVGVVGQVALGFFLVLVAVQGFQVGAVVEADLVHIAHFLHARRQADAAVRVHAHVAHRVQELDAFRVEHVGDRHLGGAAQVVVALQQGAGGAEGAVAVQVGAHRLLVDGRRADAVQLLDRHLHQRQVGQVDVPGRRVVIGAGAGAERLRQPHHDVVGAAVGGPEGARQRLVVERHPVAAVLGEALLVKRRGALLQAFDVGHRALPVAVFGQVGHRRGVIVLVDVVDDGLVGHLRHLLAAVHEQVEPVVGFPQLGKIVSPLQVAVPHGVGSGPVLVGLVAGVAGVKVAFGARIALRRDRCFVVINGVQVRRQLTLERRVVRGGRAGCRLAGLCRFAFRRIAAGHKQRCEQHWEDRFHDREP